MTSIPVSFSISGTIELSAEELGFYPDLTPETNIWRFRDRVFVGDAADAAGNRYGSQGSWLPDAPTGAQWAIRDSALLSMSPNGKIAVTGISKSGENEDDIQVPIGVAGLVINDKPGSAAWGLYSDVQHEDGAGWSAGLEVAAKNKGANRTNSPYDIHGGGGVFGAWLAAFGMDVYGGPAANPSNAAITILNNESTWNKGIVFGKDALTGSDGTTGYSVAIHMAKGQQVRWDAPNGRAADIRSDVTDTAKRVSQVYADNIVYYIGANDQKIVAYQHTPNAVNALSITNSPTTTAPSIKATGSDANIDLKLQPKGAGMVVFGEYDPTDNTLKVKDSGGNLRKLKCA